MKLSSNRSTVNCGLTSAHETCIQLQSTIKHLKGEISFLIGQNNAMREMLGLLPLDEYEMNFATSENKSVMDNGNNPFMRII